MSYWELDPALTADDYQTLGGFFICQLAENSPREGERLMSMATGEWVILSTDGPRLEDILVRQMDIPPLRALSRKRPANEALPSPQPIFEENRSEKMTPRRLTK
jgi:hypothetical protein